MHSKTYSIACLLALTVAVPMAGASCGMSADDAAMADARGGSPSFDGGAGSGGCSFGEWACSGTQAYKCGSPADLVDCAAQTKTCATGLGCVTCQPESTTCNPATLEATWCASDGSSLVTFTCDPEQGMQCSSSGCTGACSPANLAKTHVGCDFYPTVTANSAWKRWFRFGVLVANPSDFAANVLVTRGDSQIRQSVAAGGRYMFELDWVDDLKGTDATDDGALVGPEKGVLATKGAYRLRSDQPIVAMQFNTARASNTEPSQIVGCPDPTQSGCLSFSNDASLLIPATSLGSRYTVVGWQSWRVQAGVSAGQAIGDLIAITATRDATTVTLTPPADALFVNGPNDETVLGGVSSQYSLNQGDVVQLFSKGLLSTDRWSGTTIESTGPVQVISGAPCVNIPDDTIACDHIEDSVLPTAVLGKEYLVTAPWPNGVSKRGSDAARHIVRVQAVYDPADTKDQTTILSFDPSSVHGSITLRAGELTDIDSHEDFRITATRNVAVAQFMVGHGGGEAPTNGPGVGVGDPSQSICVPKARLLKDYTFASPDGYGDQRINVFAPTGTAVLMNGQQIATSEFASIGASGFSVARVSIQPSSIVRLQGAQAFGVVLYGYGPYTSFMAPVGADFRPVPWQ